MIRFLRDLSSQRQKKHDLFHQWKTKVPKHKAIFYRLADYLSFAFIVFFSICGLVGLIMFSFALISQFLEVEENGTVIMAFIFIYVSYSFLRKNDQVKGYKEDFKHIKIERILPTWVSQEREPAKLEDLLKWPWKSISIGLTLTFLLALFLTSPTNFSPLLNIWIRGLLSYLSFMAFIVLTIHILLKNKILLGLFNILLGCILITYVGCLLDSSDWSFIHTYFKHLPSYVFFRVERLSDLSLLQWFLHSSLIVGGIILWKPLWKRTFNLNKNSVKNSIEEPSHMNREKAHNILNQPFKPKPIFTLFFFKGLIWFITLISITCICYAQSTAHGELGHFIWGFFAKLLSPVCFFPLLILLFAQLCVGINRKLSISQSHVASEMGILPLDSNAVLKQSVIVAMLNITMMSVIAGIGLLCINTYSTSAIFHGLSAFESFTIGALLFCWCGISLKLLLLSFTYNLSFIYLLLALVPFVVGYYIFSNTPSEYGQHYWMVSCTAIIVLMISNTISIWFKQREQILTLTHISFMRR